MSKRGTLEKRVILDLSFPVGNSVNDLISKEFYLGNKINLTYPKVDNLVGIIKDKGTGCLVFKLEAPRSLHSSPGYNNISQ